VNCTRSQAVAALRKNGNDIVRTFVVVFVDEFLTFVLTGERDYVSQLKNKK
jgi:hypothetical protein